MLMQKTVVISQSMYFPWYGLFDQMRYADIFVHYDDVQLARGFYNRVQVKTPHGTTMITVPLKNKVRNQKINQSLISYDLNWVAQHRRVLLNSYKKTKFLDDALAIFDSVHSTRWETLDQLSRASMLAVADYLGITKNINFYDSLDLDILGSSSRRLLDITNSFNGEVYLTGRGALNYLDHDLFERNNIEVRYMKYGLTPYEQVFGSFTPYVTVLDAIAHLGKGALNHFCSTTIHWKNVNE